MKIDNGKVKWTNGEGSKTFEVPLQETICIDCKRFKEDVGCIDPAHTTIFLSAVVNKSCLWYWKK